MTFIPYFHVGILVPDIESAMERFSTVLGLSFREPVIAEIERFADPEPRFLAPKFTYSHQGPPYLELIEMTDSALHSPDHGEGLHHIGLWHPGLGTGIPSLEAAGVRHEASILAADGAPLVWFNNPSDLYGTRIEFLDEAAMRADWEASFGGRAP